MKTAYFDPVGGASGDMTLAAIVDAGLPFEELERGLHALHLPGYTLVRSAAERMGIHGTRIEVRLEAAAPPHRHLRHIEKILEDSALPGAVKARAKDVFARLAAAEAHVHGTTVEKVHFHEVGAVDAIVDVAGACLGLELLEVDEVRFGRLPLGRGFVHAAHGRIPLPAPATLELLKNLPVDMVETEGETVTPTGAALLSTLGSCRPMPPGAVLRAVGCGVGTKEFPDRPNLLRLLLAETGDGPRPGEVSVLTATVDDMNPEGLGFLMERLFHSGALDVYFSPVTMKKSRPGVEITVLAPVPLEEPVAVELLIHSSSLGLRMSREVRRELPRTVVTVQTPYGPVRVKCSEIGGWKRYSPEYEDCAELARSRGRAVREIYEAALAATRSLG